jgi:hypothetical protein
MSERYSGNSGTKLSDITGKLHAAFKRQSADVIEIGSLLRAAKKELGHGAFLPWLTREFSLSERSAERYMAVYKFFVETVAPLAKSARLVRRSALFELESLHSEGGLPTEVLQRVVSECQKTWIGKADRGDAWDCRRWKRARMSSTSGDSEQQRRWRGVKCRGSKGGYGRRRRSTDS